MHIPYSRSLHAIKRKRKNCGSGTILWGPKYFDDDMAIKDICWCTKMMYAKSIRKVAFQNQYSPHWGKINLADKVGDFTSKWSICWVYRRVLYIQSDDYLCCFPRRSWRRKFLHHIALVLTSSSPPCKRQSGQICSFVKELFPINSFKVIS